MVIRLLVATALSIGAVSLMGCSGGEDDSAPGGGPKTSPWAGKTYFLGMDVTQWYEPKSAGKEFGPFVPGFLLQVSGTDAANLTATIATATADTSGASATQELCTPTTKVAFSGAGYPDATIAVSELQMFIPNARAEPPVHATAKVYGWKMTNALPGGTAVGDFQAAMDFRQVFKLVTQVGDSRTPASVCAKLDEQLTSMDCMDPSCHVTCQPCPDGEPYCLTLKAEDAAAVEVPGLTLTEVTTPGATCADTQL